MSYLFDVKPMVLSVPACRPRYEDHQGRWFAFTPASVDQDDENRGGYWIGPIHTFEMAVLVADEENARIKKTMTEWKRQILTEICKPMDEKLVRAMGSSFVKKRA